MELDNLSENEIRVLYAQTAYPDLNDRELAGTIGMNLSTLINIRIRLEKERYIRTIAIPMIQRMGAEMLSLSYCSSETSALHQPDLETVIDTKLPREIVYSAMEANQSFFIQCCRDYTTVKENLGILEDLYHTRGRFSRGFSTVLFPFRLSMVFNYFDYSNLLAHHLKAPIERDRQDREPDFVDLGPVDMSEIDNRVLLGMIRYPDLPNTELSQKIGVSRITIGKKRREFSEKRIVILKKIPNIKKLGFELLLFMHGRFNSTLTRGLRYYVPELLNLAGPVVFAVQGADEIVTLSVFDTFTHYRAANNAFLMKYNEHELFAAPPTRILFSIQALQEIRNHDYSSLASKMLTPISTDMSL